MMAQYPEPGTRTHAIWEFIKEYALVNGGASPSVRDFVYSRVDNVTSTSVVNYHLEKLEAMGLITRRQSPIVETRTIEVVQSLFVIPDNVMKNKNVQDFKNIAFPASVGSFILAHLEMPIGEEKETIVATDDQNIALIAIGLGYGGVLDIHDLDPPEEEDEEENTRVPV
jgi:hypothetical protein